MLVLIKSGPDRAEGQWALKLARDMSADIVLLQNGAYFAINHMLDGFCGMVYAVEEDMEARWPGEDPALKGIRRITWDELVDMTAKEEKVVGAF